MQTYRCLCGNRLFFDNTCCLSCQREVGWCEACARITALEPPAAESPVVDYRCGNTACGSTIRKCSNYIVENICNRCYVPGPDDVIADAAAPAALPPVPDAPPSLPNRLCTSCQLTETIPDLSIDGHRVKWARLEAAKRRLLYTLDRLKLPYADADPRLTFDFKADYVPLEDEWRNSGSAEVVYTGHAGGKVTINIREADDAERERLRVEFQEAHRTLIGHFHHEIGHYYWELLVLKSREKDFVKAFGDHRTPSYADAMKAYYENGPRPDWNFSFISAYASAHPWEDFAECFALYLDIVSVLDTVAQLFKTNQTNFRCRSVAPLVERYQAIGVTINELNRTVGLLDLAPEVIVAPVVEKLEFIHKLIVRAARVAPPKSQLSAELVS